MTEVERIIKDGILPESFFEEEVRCDFLVTNARKKIWAIEIDLLLQFDLVCKKNNLKYWVDGGTLLGTVRHNGFIPWDDDIDVIMPRKDYDYFISNCAKFFDSPYFLQTPFTDTGYYYSYAKLRNSNTSCISKVFAKTGFNHGICIDVFPLDYVDMNSYYSNREIINECIMKNSSYMKKNCVDLLDDRQRRNFYKYHTENPMAEYLKIHEIATNASPEGSEDVANSIVTTYKGDAVVWKAKWFDETIMHKFETIEVPIPRDFDSRLKKQYGDYLSYPPVKDRGTWHPEAIWDPDKPYLEYI